MRADYETEVAADSPVGWWRLDETSGTTATNYGSTGSADGTYTDSPNLDEPGPAVDVNSIVVSGSNGVNVGDLTAWEFAGDCTFEAWINPSALSQTDAAIIAKAHSVTGFQDWAFDADTNDLEFIYFRNTSPTSTYLRARGENVLAVGEWQHVVATVSGTTVKVYLNGVDATSSTTGPTGTRSAGTTRAAGIGRRTDGTVGFQGAVSQVALYGSALSAVRVAAHYTAMLAEPPDEDCDFADDFNRPDENLTAGDWVQIAGDTLKVRSGKCVKTAQAVGASTARVDVTFPPNHRIRAEVRWLDSVAAPRLVARMTDTGSDYGGYIFGYEREVEEYRLRRRVAGVGGPVVASVDAVQPATPLLLELRTVGKAGGSLVDVECLAEGVRVICWTDPAPLTGTYVGITAGNTNDTFDQVCVSERALPGCAGGGWHVGDVSIG